MADENRITYRCNGPLTELTPEEGAALIDKIKPPFITEELHAALLDDRSFFTSDVLTVDGKTVAITRRPGGFIGLRAYCGNDVTEAVAAVEIDGQVHQVTCDKCGTVITVRKVATAVLEE